MPGKTQVGSRRQELIDNTMSRAKKNYLDKTLPKWERTAMRITTVSNTDVGKVIHRINPNEEKNKISKLQKLEMDKLSREQELFWQQRQFFINAIFDENSQIRFNKARQKTFVTNPIQAKADKQPGMFSRSKTEVDIKQRKLHPGEAKMFIEMTNDRTSIPKSPMLKRRETSASDPGPLTSVRKMNEEPSVPVEDQLRRTLTQNAMLTSISEDDGVLAQTDAETTSSPPSSTKGSGRNIFLTDDDAAKAMVQEGRPRDISFPDAARKTRSAVVTIRNDLDKKYRFESKTSLSRHIADDKLPPIKRWKTTIRSSSNGNETADDRKGTWVHALMALRHQQSRSNNFESVEDNKMNDFASVVACLLKGAGLSHLRTDASDNTDEEEDVDLQTSSAPVSHKEPPEHETGNVETNILDTRQTQQSRKIRRHKSKYARLNSDTENTDQIVKRIAVSLPPSLMKKATEFGQDLANQHLVHSTRNERLLGTEQKSSARRASDDPRFQRLMGALSPRPMEVNNESGHVKHAPSLY